MRRLEGGDDAFFFHGQVKGLDHFLVGGGLEADGLFLPVVGQDRRYADVVEAGRYRVGIEHLAVAVLQEHGLVPLGDPRRGVVAAETGGVLAAVQAVAAGLDADQFGAGFPEK